MIEVTDEMVQAWRDGMNAAAAEAVKRGAPLTETGDIAKAGLTAVLAIVERDYRITCGSDNGASGPNYCVKEPNHEGAHLGLSPSAGRVWS